MTLPLGARLALWEQGKRRGLRVGQVAAVFDLEPRVLVYVLPPRAMTEALRRRTIRDARWQRVSVGMTFLGGDVRERAYQGQGCRYAAPKVHITDEATFLAAVWSAPFLSGVEQRIGRLRPDMPPLLDMLMRHAELRDVALGLDVLHGG